MTILLVKYIVKNVSILYISEKDPYFLIPVELLAFHVI